MDELPSLRPLSRSGAAFAAVYVVNVVQTHVYVTVMQPRAKHFKPQDGRLVGYVPPLNKMLSLPALLHWCLT